MGSSPALTVTVMVRSSPVTCCLAAGSWETIFPGSRLLDTEPPSTISKIPWTFGSAMASSTVIP